MGMFDYIYCEKKLPLTKEVKKAFPDTDWSKESFQTKDLNNTMTTYAINKRGILTVLNIEGEYVRTMTEEEEKKLRKQKKLCWPYKFVESGRKYEKYDFTGAVNFYYYHEDKDNNTWDLEFVATFVKGKVTNLVLDSAKIIHTAEENAASEKAWEDKMKAHERHSWTKTKKILNKITFNYWDTFWRNIARIFSLWSRYLTKVQFWILKTM
jgi:hypothetical protein